MLSPTGFGYVVSIDDSEKVQVEGMNDDSMAHMVYLSQRARVPLGMSLRAYTFPHSLNWSLLQPSSFSRLSPDLRL